MAANPTKPASQRANSRAPKAKPSQPGHDEIAERAYFIHLEQGSFDEVANWLRAERELKAAWRPSLHLSRRCRARLDPALGGRGVAHRGLSWGGHLGGLRLGRAGLRHVRPSTLVPGTGRGALDH